MVDINLDEWKKDLEEILNPIYNVVIEKFRQVRGCGYHAQIENEQNNILNRELFRLKKKYDPYLEKAEIPYGLVDCWVTELSNHYLIMKELHYPQREDPVEILELGAELTLGIFNSRGQHQPSLILKKCK